MSTSPSAAPNRPQLLLVAGSDQSPSTLVDALADAFAVSIAHGAKEALARLAQTPADIIVALDPLPDMSGEEFCRQLQELPARQFGICVVLTDDTRAASVIRMFQSGADDCLPLSINPPELVARLQALVGCCQRHRQLNPLTGLPGNAYLEREITRRLPRRGQLAVVAFDLADFKAYNDVYGYYRGDRVISVLARILSEVVNRYGQDDDCVAHIGGDDFFVLTVPERMHNLAQAATTEFEQVIPELYDEEDRRRGGIISFTRQGQELFFPIMRLIATAATNEAEDVAHVGQIASILGQLKEYARRTGNRGLVVDRRQTHAAHRAWQQRPAE